MKTISQATMEAILTEPGGRLVVKEVRHQVEEMLQIESKGSAIPNCFSNWVKAGILKRIDYGVYEFEPGGRKEIEALKARADKRKYKKRPGGQPAKRSKPKPQPPAELDSLQIGNAIIDKIDSLRQEITELKNRVADAARRHDADLKAWRQNMKGKDATIRELKLELDRQQKANEVKKRTVKLSEVAVIR